VRALLLLGLIAVLAGCGADEAATPLPPPLGSNVLPALTSRDRELPADVLAEDAFEQDELRGLLDEGGYAGGRERELSGHTDTFDHVIARTLRFDRPDGAAAYIGWVAAHTLDLVGRTRPLPPLPLGDESRLFELEPCSTCKKQLPTLVAVWRRGGAVGYVLASGRKADRSTVGPLAAQVDQSLSDAAG
jgi:hypothetical protein